MNLKTLLVIMTAIAVVSDSMLIPFYPQYFSDRFGVTSPEHVGAYIAAFCFTVMLALPGWARVAKRVETLKLLVFTQLGAGILSVWCFWSDSLLEFWLVSLGMFACKGSYLLMYPYVMSLENKDQHEGTIGMLSLVVHFGGILGAIVGGFVLRSFAARDMFLVMAAGDFIQILMCLYQINFRKSPSAGLPPENISAKKTALPRNVNRSIYQLGFVMLLFYFSAYLVRPFFALYWQTIVSDHNPVTTALVFAIPGGMALLALWINHQTSSRSKIFHSVTGSLLLGVSGLLLQGAPFEIAILVGRCLFGWSLFQVTVRLDLNLFELSTPEEFASDFSKINIFQNLGVIASSFVAGTLVSNWGLSMPFFVAACGLLLSVLAFSMLTDARRNTVLVS